MQEFYVVRGSEVVGVATGEWTPPDNTWLMVPVEGEVVGNLNELKYIDGKIVRTPAVTFFSGSWVKPPEAPVESVLDKKFAETELFLKAKEASATRLEVMSEFAVALYSDIIKNQTLFNQSVSSLMKLLEKP